MLLRKKDNYVVMQVGSFMGTVKRDSFAIPKSRITLVDVKHNILRWRRKISLMTLTRIPTVTMTNSSVMTGPFVSTKRICATEDSNATMRRMKTTAMITKNLRNTYAKKNLISATHLMGNVLLMAAVGTFVPVLKHAVEITVKTVRILMRVEVTIRVRMVESAIPPQIIPVTNAGANLATTETIVKTTLVLTTPVKMMENARCIHIGGLHITNASANQVTTEKNVKTKSTFATWIIVFVTIPTGCANVTKLVMVILVYVKMSVVVIIVKNVQTPVFRIRVIMMESVIPRNIRIQVTNAGANLATTVTNVKLKSTFAICNPTSFATTPEVNANLMQMVVTGTLACVMTDAVAPNVKSVMEM